MQLVGTTSTLVGSRCGRASGCEVGVVRGKEGGDKLTKKEVTDVSCTVVPRERERRARGLGARHTREEMGEEDLILKMEKEMRYRMPFLGERGRP